MIYDIDRINALLVNAKLPPVEPNDARTRRPADSGHFSALALGLNRLETHYDIGGLDHWRKGRSRPSVRFRQQVPMMAGERLKALEMYQSLLADKTQPLRVERTL